MSGKVTLKILGYDPDTQKNQVHESAVEFQEGMTVLAALKQAADDIGLAFRWSCACGMCAICMMRINGKTRLACDTVVEGPGELTIEPLKDHRIYRDLFTDLTREGKENGAPSEEKD